MLLFIPLPDIILASSCIPPRGYSTTMEYITPMGYSTTMEYSTPMGYTTMGVQCA